MSQTNRYFKHKTVWVSGASSGIGKALALKSVHYGAKVIISGRNKEALIELQKSHPDSIQILDFDLEDTIERNKAIERLKTMTPTLDIFIHSAGLSQRSLALETELSTARTIMEVNFFAATHLTTELLKQKIIKQGGQLVILSSVTGYIGTPKRSTYAASKHALHGYFNSLRAELHGKDIAITLLCPGYVNTGIDTRSLLGNGQPQLQIDTNRPTGFGPAMFADRAMHSIAKRKEESYIGGHELLGIYFQRFFPGIVSKLLHKFSPEMNSDI